MSQNATPKKGDIVEIPGVKGKIKLFDCDNCGKVIGLENIETDPKKKARWNHWNLDGSKHVEPPKEKGGKPQRLKFTVEHKIRILGRNTGMITEGYALAVEFYKDETDYQKAFDEVRAALLQRITKEKIGT